MQRVQDPSQSNAANIHSARCEGSTVQKQNKECLKGKIKELEIISKIKNSRVLHKEIMILRTVTSLVLI
jgi:hypothetical protein